MLRGRTSRVARYSVTILAVALAVHVAALYLPFAQFVLRVEPIDLDAWVRIELVASTILLAMDLHKLLRRS